MDFDLFKKEKDVIENAKSAIDEHQDHLPAKALEAFKTLLSEYQKLSKSTQRLIKLSDRNEKQLRNAHDQIAQQKSELERQQAELVRAEKLASLGQLVSGVAHELNTPLGIILTSATALQGETDHLEKLIKSATARKSDVALYMESAKETSELMVRHCENASSLIQSFKAVAVDRHSDALRTFSLKQLIDDVIRSLSPSLKNSLLQFSLSIDEHLVLTSYPGDLNQVLTNLILNAHQHAFKNQPQPLISIQAAHLGERLVLDFCDNGCGIPDENASLIFDPFFTTARDQGGSGLGLHIVHNLVSAKLQGSIRLSSSDGQGSCFTIDLPLIIINKDISHE